MEVATRAFVIGKEIVGERDMQLSLYTADFGKVAVRVRGYRSLHSKLRPQLLFFSQALVSFHQSSRGWLVIGAETIKGHQTLIPYKPALQIGCVVCDLTNTFAPPNERDERFYAALERFFSEVSIGALQRDIRTVLDGALRFLGLAALLWGYAPEITVCVRCGLSRDHRWFSLAEGGVLCAVCGSGAGEALRLTPGLITCLRAYARETEHSGAPEAEDMQQTLLLLIGFLRWRRS